MGRGKRETKYLPDCEMNGAVGTLKWIILDVWNSSVTESWDYKLPAFFFFETGYLLHS